MAMPMDGFRVLEVAQFTFVPAAGGVLSDWGADVIKVEHPVRGDAQRGMTHLQNLSVNPQRAMFMQHPNRGKRSIGIDIASDAGRELLYELVASCDVFLTNYLPGARQKLKIDLEHIRACNPNIVYARGSALGDKGPEREKGGFDATAFWARGGSAMLVAPEALGGPRNQPGPAYGDTISGMNLAGGIAAALLHRERTGEPLEVDVSLLSSGVWSTAMSIDVSLDIDRVPFVNMMPGEFKPGSNPFVGTFRTRDGAFLSINVLTPDTYLRDTLDHLGLSHLAQDPRFADGTALLASADSARTEVAAAIAAQPMEYWRERLKTFKGQWAPYQTALEAGRDEQVLANGMVFEVESPDGGSPMKLVANPVQFNHRAVSNERAPEASEHTELILMEFGVDWDRIEALKRAGAVA